MKPTQIPTVVVLLMLSPASSASCEVKAPESQTLPTTQELDRRFLWQGEDRDEALFIPEAALLGERDLLPFGRWSSRFALEEVIDQFRTGRRACLANQSSGGQGSAPNPGGIIDIVQKYEAAFVGKVLHVVHGWSPWTLRISRVVYFEVGDILKQPLEDPIVGPGQVLGVLRTGGAIMVDGLRVCQEISETSGPYLPGDEFLVAGLSWEADANFFYAGAVLPIIDGEVHPLAYPTLRKLEQPQPLTSIRRSLLTRGEKVP